MLSQSYVIGHGSCVCQKVFEIRQTQDPNPGSYRQGRNKQLTDLPDFKNRGPQVFDGGAFCLQCRGVYRRWLFI